MAIALNPVANDLAGDLKSTSLEALLFEASFNLQERETRTAQPTPSIAVNVGLGNNIATIAANIPVEIIPDAVEGFTFRAIPNNSIVNDGYDKSAGLALTGDSLNSNILECAQRLQAIERAADPLSDEIQVSLNTDTLIATIAASLPFTVTVDGDIRLVAAPFIDNGL